MVRLSGEDVHLTPTEFKLLTFLVRHAGKVITHGQLLREVWGKHSQGQEHYVRIHVHKLRQKIEKDPARPQGISIRRRAWGIGSRSNGSGPPRTLPGRQETKTDEAGPSLDQLLSIFRVLRTSSDYPGSSFGGGRGIRTPGRVSPSMVFKTTALNRSAIPPRVGNSSTRPAPRGQAGKNRPEAPARRVPPPGPGSGRDR